jgi:hypothetical protein
MPDTTAEAEIAKCPQRISGTSARPTIMATWDGGPISWCQWYPWADYPAGTGAWAHRAVVHCSLPGSLAGTLRPAADSQLIANSDGVIDSDPPDQDVSSGPAGVLDLARAQLSRRAAPGTGPVAERSFKSQNKSQQSPVPGHA